MFLSIPRYYSGENGFKMKICYLLSISDNFWRLVSPSKILKFARLVPARSNCQRHLKSLSAFLCLALLLLNPFLRVNVVIGANYGWKVQVGDSELYIYTKVYDYFSETHHRIVEFVYNGTTPRRDRDVPIVIWKGSTFNVTITSLGAFNESYCQVTYNRNITCMNKLLIDFVWPTIDNRSYWERECENNENEKLSGDLISFESQSTNDNYDSDILKWNWKTGWITYCSSRRFNQSTILYELEYKLKNYKTKEPFLQSNIILGTLILLVITTTLFLTTKYHKKGV